MKYRLERVNELIRRELGEIIARELEFHGALVTVQQVDVSPDLRSAHVFISIIGGAGDLNQRGSVLSKLEDHRVQLQQLMSKRVILKYTPHLHFQLHEGIARGVRVNQLIDELDIPADAPPEATDE